MLYSASVHLIAIQPSPVGTTNIEKVLQASGGWGLHSAAESFHLVVHNSAHMITKMAFVSDAVKHPIKKL